MGTGRWSSRFGRRASRSVGRDVPPSGASGRARAP
jgi:hypothetical protein